MNKAIDTLESLREYLENEVRPNCEYYIYSNLIDVTKKVENRIFKKKGCKWKNLKRYHILEK